MLKNIFLKFRFEIIIFIIFFIILNLDSNLVNFFIWLGINYPKSIYYIFWFNNFLLNFYIYIENNYIEYWITIFNFISNVGFSGYFSNFIYINKSFMYGFKFILSLLFLIFIRAGIPRYRYDFLTILGWSRFLFLCFFIFIVMLILFFLN